MPKMYNPKYKGDLIVHPSNVDNMKRKGWTLEPETKKASSTEKKSSSSN